MVADTESHNLVSKLLLKRLVMNQLVTLTANGKQVVRLAITAFTQGTDMVDVFGRSRVAPRGAPLTKRV